MNAGSALAAVHEADGEDCGNCNNSVLEEAPKSLADMQLNPAFVSCLCPIDNRHRRTRARGLSDID